MKSGLSIVIPTKDRGAILSDTLESIYTATKDTLFEIIIVNDSKTNTPVIANQADHKVRLVNNPASGAASARNLGASMAQYNYLLFLDDDMQMNASNISIYNKYMEANQTKTVVNLDWDYPPEILKQLSKYAFGRYLMHFGFTSLKGWNGDINWFESAIIETKSITSQNLLIHKSLFDQVQGYNEIFPFAGYEDLDFSSRLMANGARILIDTRSQMLHNEADRLNPKDWFERKKRGGATRRVAVEQGIREVEIKYSSLKLIWYKLLVFFKPVIFLFISLISCFKFLDSLSFFCYNHLLGIAIFQGYTSKV
jgi:glycosyltransferase involved in cell wall biosynthesis